MNYNLKVGLVVLLALVRGMHPMDDQVDVSELIGHFNTFGQAKHLSRRHISCGSCSRQFYSQQDYLAHCADSHQMSSTASVMDIVGIDNTAALNALSSEMDVDHESGMASANSQLQKLRTFTWYMCTECRIPFELLSGALNHVRRAHATSRGPDKLITETVTQNAQRDLVLQCSCGKQCRRFDELRAHQRTLGHRLLAIHEAAEKSSVRPIEGIIENDAYQDSLNFAESEEPLVGFSARQPINVADDLSIAPESLTAMPIVQDMEKLYTCKQCGRNSKTRNGLSRHINIAHDIPMHTKSSDDLIQEEQVFPETMRQQLTCPDCYRGFGRFDKIELHKQRNRICKFAIEERAREKQRAARALEAMAPQEPTIPLETVDQTYIWYECLLCGSRYHDDIHMNTHMRSVHPTSSQESIKTHRGNEREAFYCDICKASYGSSSKFNNHKRRNKTFPCYTGSNRQSSNE